MNRSRRRTRRFAASLEQLVGRQASLWNEAVSTHQDHMQQTLQQMLSDQAALWNESVAAAQQQWAHQMKSTSTDLRLQVDQALTGSLQDYVGQLVHQESASGERVERHWQQLQHAITENARIMQVQQSELARQGDALLQSVQQIREVTRVAAHVGRKLVIAQHGPPAGRCIGAADDRRSAC